LPSEQSVEAIHDRRLSFDLSARTARVCRPSVPSRASKTVRLRGNSLQTHPYLRRRWHEAAKNKATMPRTNTICAERFEASPCNSRTENFGNQALSRIDPGTGPETLKEFYKKGCQEKSSAWSGGARLFREIQPTLFRYPGRGLACDPFS
jgi:hypothetical protein